MKPGQLLLTLLLLLLPCTAYTQTAPPKTYTVFQTSLGDVLVEMYPDIAPRHVAQIRKLVDAGLYDGVDICRIEPGFVAQVNDVRWRNGTPLPPEQAKPLTKIPAEFSNRLHTRGILSMAREDKDINSAESSFSFLLGNAPHLDNKYTIFGRVIGGIAVLNRLDKVPLQGRTTAPRYPVTILHAYNLSAQEAKDIRLELPPLEETGQPGNTLTITKRGILGGNAMIGLALGIMLCAFGTAFAAMRRAPQVWINALALATFLTAFFQVFAVLTIWKNPNETWQQMYASASFFGALLCFRLMGRFESSEKK